MKKHLAIACLLALTTASVQARAERRTSPPTTPATPRQFSSAMALPSVGSARLIIVATAADEGRAQSTISRVLSQLSSSAGSLSAEIRGVNEQPRKSPVAISSKLAGILKECKRFSALTRGAFDITGTTKGGGFSFVKRDWRRLKVGDKRVTIKSDDVSIDPTTFGIALRGFLADDAIAMVVNQGWKNAQIKIGNVTRNIGRDIHTSWTIRLDAPTAAEKGKHAYRAYNYSVGDVASAIISPRIFPEGIVDPRSRTLVTNPAIINTIIFANKAATASAYAIATYANSAVKAEYGQQFIQAHPEIKGIVIALDGTVLTSSGLDVKKPTYQTAHASTDQ